MTRSKHPGLDATAQLARLRAAERAADGRLSVQVTDCLGPCAWSNVVVVRPSALGRRRGGRPTWLGFVLDDAGLDALTDWAMAGGPGLVEPPELLDLQRFVPPRRVRDTAADQTGR